MKTSAQDHGAKDCEVLGPSWPSKSDQDVHGAGRAYKRGPLHALGSA